MTLHKSPDSTTSGQPAPWEEYPSRVTARTSCLDGIGYIRDRLERDLERLFSDQVNADVLSLRAGERVLVQSYTDEESLDSFLETNPPNNSESIVVLKQRNTYASLQITSDLFKRLLAVHKVFPPFLNYIHSFGYRRSAGDEFFNSYHCRYFSSPGGVKDGSYEFCYNIRYAAKNGRKTNGSAWSIRHMAIYEQHDSTLGSSRWIMVQPSDDYKAQVVEYLDSEVSATGGTIDPLVLHAMLFDSSERDWRDYINDLEEELKVLEEKALFSRVGRVHPADFSVTFSDLQALHRLRKKMLKVHGILDSTVEIATGYEKHCHKLRDSGGCAADHFIFAQMDIIMAQLRNHKRSMFMLLEQSESISKLLFQILQYRNEENMLATNRLIHISSDATNQTNQLIQQNGETISRLATSSYSETKAIVRLTEDSQRDARSVKVLTFIAMLYLPASLVATIFSSNLIHTDGVAQHFAVATQFWMYPVYTFALMLLTVIPVVAWERYSKWRDTPAPVHPSYP